MSKKEKEIIDRFNNTKRTRWIFGLRRINKMFNRAIIQTFNLKRREVMIKVNYDPNEKMSIKHIPRLEKDAVSSLEKCKDKLKIFDPASMLTELSQYMNANPISEVTQYCQKFAKCFSKLKAIEEEYSDGMASTIIYTVAEKLKPKARR
jgi:hypothetical protein